MSYEKANDLLDLAIWMQSSREGVSLNEISERFGVSRRTAERMRDMIINRFHQAEEIIGDNNQKRWYIPQGTLKDFIQFSADDLNTLETACTMFKQKQLPDKEKTMQKIINMIKASVKSDVISKIIRIKTSHLGVSPS